MGFSYRTSRFSLLNVLPLLVWSTGPAQRAPQCPHDSGTTSGISCILLTWRMSLSLTYDPESNDLVIRWLQCFAQHFSLNMDILFHHSCTRHRCLLIHVDAPGHQLAVVYILISGQEMNRPAIYIYKSNTVYECTAVVREDLFNRDILRKQRGRCGEWWCQ